MTMIGLDDANKQVKNKFLILIILTFLFITMIGLIGNNTAGWLSSFFAAIGLAIGFIVTMLNLSFYSPYGG